MSGPKHGGDDIGDLITQAQDQIAVADARRKVRIDRSGFLARAIPALSVVILAVAMIWAGGVLRRHFPSHSDDQIVRDLEAIIEQARHAVESARGEFGQLPERIPNASLAAVVYYESAGDVFRLIAESDKVRVTLDTDGKRKVDKRPD